jgi:hypothetical protein
MINYDYDDMVNAGLIKVAARKHKHGERKYAVIIKSAYAKIGRFDITDPESVKESIYALDNNPDIPDAIRKSAEYFVKQAADYYGISYDVQPESAPHDIVVSDILSKTAEYEHVIMLSFGDRKFILDTENNIKTAEEYFLRKKSLLPPKQRINVSRIIDKRASESGYDADPVIKAYSRAQYGNQTKEVLLKKAALCGNPKYASVMESLSKCYNSIPVEEFLGMVESCDKAAEVRHNVYGIETHDLISSADDPPDISVEKKAEDILLGISSPVGTKE